MIEALVRAGIPVMGHIGLTPQTINTIGKIRVQGKTRDQARSLIADALAVQEAGAFSMVLELVPEQLAAAITERLRIPTIGIGAGAGCSGQVQIITDLVGLGDFIPRHARPYAHLRETIRDAATAYAADVAAGTFPGPEQSVRMDDGGARRGPRPRVVRPAGEHPGRRDPARSRPLTRTSARLTRIVRTRAELRDALDGVARPIGLIPTMGWLHEGHRALIRQARAADATTVVTIFVNPRQFQVAEDYTRYPRDEARDLEICESEGVDLVFVPDATEIYPPGSDTTVSVGAIAQPLEGAARPGHFDGVATVVVDPVRPGGRRARLFRAEGCPAGDGDPPDGAGPGDPDDGHRLPDGARTRWPRPVVPKRAPLPRRAPRGHRPAPGPADRPRWLGGRRAIGRGPARRDAPRSRGRTPG